MKAQLSVVLDPCDNDHDQPVATASLGMLGCRWQKWIAKQA